MLHILPIFCKLRKKDDVANGKIRLNEVTHSVFYAPLYVAINLGYMKDEGIEIELTNGGGSDVSMSALLSGSADIALMGPETVVYVENSGSTNHPIVFGQLTQKDGCFLISKTKIDDFDFARDLRGKTAIIGRNGGMPAMTFTWVCNNFGLKKNIDVTLDTDTAFNMMVPVFDSTDAEFCTMFEPNRFRICCKWKRLLCWFCWRIFWKHSIHMFHGISKILKRTSRPCRGLPQSNQKSIPLHHNRRFNGCCKSSKAIF